MVSLPLDSPLVLLIAGILGYTLRGRAGPVMRNLLGNMNILLFMPLVMGVTFAKRGFQVSDAWIIIGVIFYVTVMLFITLWITRGYPPVKRVSLLMVSIFPNSVNLPFPLLLSLRGDYYYAAMFAVVINLVQVVFVAVSAYIVLGRREGGFRALGFLLKGLTPFLGAAVGLIIHECCYHPNTLWAFLDFLKSLGIFMFVFVAGLSMPSLSTGILKEPGIRLVTINRFLIAPIVVLIYSFLSIHVGLYYEYEALVQLIIESIMPPAVINVSYSAAFGFDTEVAAVSVVILTLPGALLGVILSLGL